jgi:hypothetical protein
VLIDSRTEQLAVTSIELLANDVNRDATQESITYLRKLFSEPSSLGSVMAGRADEGVGNPEVVSQRVAILAGDLLNSISRLQ